MEEYKTMDIFCQIIEGKIEALKCFEDDDVVVIMDANPKRPGHLLIIPKKHYTTLLDLDDDILVTINNTAKSFIQKMFLKYPKIKSVVSIVNYGEEQKVKHYHLHLIPDYGEEEIQGVSQEEFCRLLKY